MTSVVMTGRRMQSSERRMAGFPLLAAAVHAPLFGGRLGAGRAARLLDGDGRPRRKADLAIRDDALSGLQALAQVGGLADDALDHDGARCHLVVGADDPG